MNFESQIKDYIDSVSKIGIIGVKRNELDAEEKEKADIMELKSIVKIIGERPWTEKKETIRTVEHYKKLFFDGDNSVIQTIYTTARTEYKAVLAEKVCNETEYWRNICDYGYLDTICNDESEAYDKYSMSIALLYLIENKSIDKSTHKLLELVDKEYRLEYDKENPVKNINFGTVLKLLTKDKKNLRKHMDEFDLDSEFLSSLYAFTEYLLFEEKDLKNINDCYDFLSSDFDSHWIQTYHEALGGYSVPNLVKSLYSLAYIKTSDYDDYKKLLNDNLNNIEGLLDKTRTAIVSILDDLREILNEKDALSSYPERLSKIKTGISFIKSIIDSRQSYSELLLLNSIIEHIRDIIHNSEKFRSQIVNIYKMLKMQKDKIDVIQEDIDNIYNDSLTEKLISFKYEKKRNNGYLWKKNFLTDYLKKSDEYEKLWGETKNYYNPFGQSVVTDYKITDFKKYLDETYSRLRVSFDDLLKDLKAKNNLAKQSQELDKYISELLKVKDND